MKREEPRYRVEQRSSMHIRVNGGGGWNVIDTHKVVAVALGVSEEKARAIAAERNG